MLGGHVLKLCAVSFISVGCCWFFAVQSCFETRHLPGWLCSPACTDLSCCTSLTMLCYNNNVVLLGREPFSRAAAGPDPSDSV